MGDLWDQDADPSKLEPHYSNAVDLLTCRNITTKSECATVIALHAKKIEAQAAEIDRLNRVIKGRDASISTYVDDVARCKAEWTNTRNAAAGIEGHLRAATAEIAALRELLGRFRAAKAFAGAEAWDGGSDMVERFSAASAASDAVLGVMTNDEIAAFGKKFHAENSTIELALRTQPERDWIGERLRWKPYEAPDNGAALYLCDLWVGECFNSDVMDNPWQVRIAEGGLIANCAAEAEARAAVEKAVREALGVKATAEPARTCETCSGHGMIGWVTHTAIPEFDAVPCPDCSAVANLPGDGDKTMGDA